MRKYTAPLAALGLEPGGPPAGEQVWEQRIAQLFPEVVDRRLRQVTWPQIEGRRDFIVEQLDAGVTVATISQRLNDEHGLAASESSVRRWMTANLAEQVARSKASPPRPPMEPGSEAQIDYGRLGSWGRPGHRPASDVVGVRDGAGLFPADVRAPGAPDGPNILV